MVEAHRHNSESHNGRLIRPQYDPSPAIREAAETNTDSEKSPQLTYLYHKTDIILPRLYPQIPRPGFDGVIPAPLLAIEPRDIRVLADYRVVADGYGLDRKLTMNERYYVENSDAVTVWMWGEWALLETLTHELGHHVQQLVGKNPYKPGKMSHNQEFVNLLQRLGIYSSLGNGAHYKPADLDGPFGILMKELGVTRPETPEDFVPKDKKEWWRFFFEAGVKGKSSLTKWMCEICGFPIRVGVKGDVLVTHDPDQGKFVRA